MLGSQRVGFTLEVENVNQDWWRDKCISFYIYLLEILHSTCLQPTHNEDLQKPKPFVKTPLVPLPTNRGRWAPWIKKWRTIQPQIQQKTHLKWWVAFPFPPKNGFWIGTWTLLNKHMYIYIYSGNGIGLICASRHSLTFLHDHTACHWKVRFPNIGILGRIPRHSVVE